MKKSKLIIISVAMAIMTAIALFQAISLLFRVVDKAVVLSSRDASLRVYTGNDHSSSLMVAGLRKNTRVVNEEGKRISITDIQPGQLVEITHEGLIFLSYPGQYGEIYQIKVVGQADEAFYSLGKEREAEFQRFGNRMLEQVPSSNP